MKIMLGVHRLQGRRDDHRHHLAADGHQIEGISQEIMRVAPARPGTTHPHPRRDVEGADRPRARAPRIRAPASRTFKIATTKIRSDRHGGKVIREIVEKTAPRSTSRTTGTAEVASNDGDAMMAAIKWIK